MTDLSANKPRDNRRAMVRLQCPSSGRYVHWSGMQSTAHENEAWSGTRHQADNLLAPESMAWARGYQVTPVLKRVEG